MGKETGKRDFLFVGNEPCLDFVNTNIQEHGKSMELLGDFTDLLRWLGESELLEPEVIEGAREKWADSEEGQDGFQKALSFRATLRRMAEQLVTDQKLTDDVVEHINEILRRPGRYPQLQRSNGGMETRRVSKPQTPVDLLIPIANSARELLSERDWSLVKKCDNPECVLYFYDTTKNHSRRWCSMDVCGNRMKVRRYHERQKEETE